MTVTRTQPDNLGDAYYSYFGGNSEPLSNGDIEYNLSSFVINGNLVNSVIQERTAGADSTVVWELDESGENFYRGYRNPSLYPGVTWAEGAGISEAARQAHRVKPGQKVEQHKPMGPQQDM
jgi:hypothetical protein